jgi:hypothetical protein
MIKVKIFNMHMHRSDNPMDAASLEEDIGRMEGFNYYFIPNKDYIYKNLKLTVDEDYDFAIVLDQVFCKNYFDPSKSILFRLEPEILRRNFKLYNDSVNASSFFKVYDLYTLWSIPYPQMDSSNFNKSKILSTIVSSNYGTPMHKKRLDFVRKLDETLPYFEHYGRGDFSGMRSHKGCCVSRIEGLQEYKYHFNSENAREATNFSEKILDPILSECLTFYDGCLELERFINPEAFIRVNLDDFEQSLHIIKTAILNQEWERRIDIIRQTKWEIFNRLNPLELAYNAINGVKNYFEE